jgi:hypothetical protein
MTSYVERYREGQREEVWNELSALGALVFEDAVYSDALEVARETMRRARRNVELLIQRLDGRGYRFADSVSTAEDELSTLDTMDFLSAQMKAFESSRSGSMPAHMQGVMDTVSALQSKFMPMIEKSRSRASEAASRDRKPPLQDPNVYCPPSTKTLTLLTRLEKEIGGQLPLSLKAWYEEVGSVSLLGSDPVLNPAHDVDRSVREMVAQRMQQALSMPRSRAPGESLQDFYVRLQGGFRTVENPPRREEQSLADPLVIFPVEELLDQLSDRDCNGREESIELVIAPDDLHKANISGDATYLTLPSRSADFPFNDWHRKGFVDYLRAVFQWGGFPGWARSSHPPLAVIAELKEGLLPI